MYRDAVASEDELQTEDQTRGSLDAGSESTVEPGDQSNDLTRSIIRLTNLPTYPLDRLSRYEATLWRHLSDPVHLAVFRAPQAVGETQIAR